jgi:hypothetical protein
MDMMDELFFVWSAIWQEQTTAIALYAAGYGFWKGYFILLCGSSIGIVLLYFFPEYTRFIGHQVSTVARNVVSLNGYRKETTRFELWCIQLWAAIERERERRIEKLVNHGFPQMAIFFATAIPIPFVFVAPIAAARILKLHRGFTIVYAASVVRSFIIALIVYRVFVALD